MFELKVRQRFEASHQLDCEGPCGRLHGHRYELTVCVRGDRLIDGMVMDLDILDEAVSKAVALVDHRHLNDILNVNPTAEHLLIWFKDQLRHLPVAWLEVQETESLSIRLIA